MPADNTAEGKVSTMMECFGAAIIVPVAQDQRGGGAWQGLSLQPGRGCS